MLNVIIWSNMFSQNCASGASNIDLRWGVTSAEAESGKVLDICLDQIDGSRPFFICMLGNRYGWVPDKKEVSEHTRNLFDRLHGKEDYSITHLEIQHAVLEPLRSLDALEEVPHAFFYFRDHGSLPSPDKLINLSDFEKEQYRKTFFEEDTIRVTRLENLKEEIREHYGKIGRLKGISDEAEKRIFCYQPAFDPDQTNPEDDKLKGRIVTESLKEFGERVKTDLQKSITLEFNDRIKSLTERKDQNELDIEHDLHESFVENRTRLFIGRTETLKKLHEYVNGASDKVLAIYGEAGSGKSALVARFYKEFKYDLNGNEINKNVLFIPHFAGASPGSCFLPTMLKRFCEELKITYDIKDPIPQESNKLSETFKAFINKARGKVIILIDGLNQLDEAEHAHELYWLPAELPKSIKIIVSTLEGKTKDVLAKRSNESLYISSLSVDECREIINRMPSVFCKTLDETHIESLLAKTETRNPLYLKVALDELRVFGSFEKLQEKIASFPSEVVDLFVSVLDRLERDNFNEKTIVERIFCLIECSRSGIAPQELRELMKSVDIHNTYQVILRQMRDYMISRGELLDFFHRGFSKAVRQKYLQHGDEIKWHQVLASFYENQPLKLEIQKQNNISSQQPNLRKLHEQSWQQTKGELWKELEDTLTDPDYIETKCEAELRYELVEDYNIAQESWPGNEEKRKEEDRLERIKQYSEGLIVYSRDSDHNPLPGSPAVEFMEEDADTNKKESWTPLECIQAWGHFVANNILIIQSKESVYQLAYNYAESGPIQRKIREIDATGKKQSTPWIKLKNRPAFRNKPACVRALYGHNNRVTSVAISTDGLKAISAGEYELRAWDIKTGECMWILSGAKGVDMTADGSQAVSGGSSSNENTVKIWDLQTGRCTKEFQGHIDSVTTTSVTYDGRLAASGSCGWHGNDTSVRVWNLASNELVYISDAHSSRIKRVRISPGGNYVISQAERSSLIYVWDLKTSTKLYEIRSEPGACFQATLDEQKLIIATRNTIKTCILKDGNEISSLKHEHNNLLDISITPDGNYAVTAGWNQKLWLWDLLNSRCIKVIEEQGITTILSIAVTPDFRFAITGEISGTVRIWDLQTKPGPVSEKHQYDIHDILASKNNSIILTGSSYSLNEYNSTDDFRLWDLTTQKCIKIIKHNEQGGRGIFINPDGLGFISGHNKSLNYWNFNGDRISKLECNPTASGWWRWRIAITPDGNKAIIPQLVDKKVTLVIWNLTDGQVARSDQEEHGTFIHNIKTSYDGKQIIMANSDKIIRIWDLENMKYIGEMKGHESEVDSISISPDNRCCISYDRSGKVILWDIQSKQIIKHPPSYHRVDHLDFLPDGRFFIEAGLSMGYSAIKCDLRNNKSLFLKGYDGLDWRVSYDNSVILTRDGKIFNLQDGSVLTSVNSSQDSFCSFAAAWPHLIFGRNSGNVSFYTLENFVFGPAIVTPVRLWIYAPTGQRGHWDENVTTCCPWCGKRIPVGKKILDVIDGITRQTNLAPEQSPCLHLPDEAWDEPKLVSECPSCKKALKYNPFKVDNK